MFDAERSQLHYDFKLAPRLVKKYIPEPEQKGSLKAVRQINGVSTYLSQMACGEPRHVEAVYYAVALAGIDCVTDYRGEVLYDSLIRDALHGEWAYPELEPVHIASQMACGDKFDSAILSVADWQDASLEQFDSPSVVRLREITRGKGGYSALGHLHAMKENPSEREDEFMLDFGHLMQLLDDYIDQPHDRFDGISTVFTGGDADYGSLLGLIAVVEKQAADIWGESPAHRRFFKICRAHARLGKYENETRFPVKRAFPFYF